MRKLLSHRLGLPNTKPASPTSNSKTLCTTCANIPIRSLFLPSVTPQESPVPHDYLDSLLSRVATCALCRLLCHSIHTALKIAASKPPPSPLEPLVPPDGPRLRCYLQRIQSGWLLEESRLRTDGRGLKVNYEYKAFRIGVTLAAEVEESREDLEWNQPGMAVQPLESPPVRTKTPAETVIALLQLLGEDAAIIGSVPRFHGREVAGDINMDLLRSWLRSCTEKHQECKRESWKNALPSPIDIRVIDVHKNMVVKAKAGCRYVALSYVWGGDQSFKLLKENYKKWAIPGGMPAIEELPKSIRDAIALTKAIGERYLWIDSLCIVQDDIALQRDQIGQMDRIYGSSLFTIAAAEGNNADVGLPGLLPGTGSRQQMQMIEEVQGLRIAVPLPTLRDTMSFSYWNTRGWTYQERLLSQKMMFFTGHQTYYQCNRDVWCEDVCAEEHSRRLHKQTYPSIGLKRVVMDAVRTQDRHEHRPTTHTTFAEYMSLVEEYTARQLTVPDDGLNAFMGIANLLRHLPGSRSFVGGLPVMDFDNAILWLPRGQIQRRVATR
jgi:hypothetical protein